MSFKNPTAAEIIDYMGNHPMVEEMNKTYLNAAKNQFYRKHCKAKPTLDDAEELVTLFLIIWKHRNVTIPKIKARQKAYATEIWNVGCYLKVDVKKSTLAFVRELNPTFDKVYDFDYAAWIGRYGMEKEYRAFCKKNRAKFPYKKQRNSYPDYSHLAYNGVTDDF